MTAIGCSWRNLPIYYGRANYSELPPRELHEDDVMHRIELGTTAIFRPEYRLSFQELEEAEQQILSFLNAKIVEESESPNSSPILFTRKKDARCACA